MKNALDLSLEEWQKYLVSLMSLDIEQHSLGGLHKHLYHHGDSFSILSSALRQQLEQTYSFILYELNVRSNQKTT